MEVVVGAAAALAAAAGLGYRYYKMGGNVDVEADMTEGTIDADISSCDGEDDIDHRIEDDVLPDVEATPEYVQNIGNDLDSIKGIGSKRAEVLRDAGFLSAGDLYYADDEDITAVDGFGDHAVGQIREDIGSVEEDDEGESNESTPSENESHSSSEDDTSEEQEDSEDDGSGDDEDTEEDEEEGPTPEADGDDAEAAA